MEGLLPLGPSPGSLRKSRFTASKDGLRAPGCVHQPLAVVGRRGLRISAVVPGFHTEVTQDPDQRAVEERPSARTRSGGSRGSRAGTRTCPSRSAGPERLASAPNSVMNSAWLGIVVVQALQVRREAGAVGDRVPAARRTSRSSRSRPARRASCRAPACRSSDSRGRRGPRAASGRAARASRAAAVR